MRMRIWTKRTRTRKPTTKTKKPRTGSSWALAFLLVLYSALCIPVASGAKKDKPNASTAFALIAGTVYRPPGFALPGAEVRISPEQSEVNGIKLKKEQAITNTRGEWAVRVPPVPAKWRVDVKMDGYRPEQKSVSVEGEQRVDLSIILEPAGPTKETVR
jgi:hypothetical protein